MTSTAADAKQIRVELKAQGLTSKDVSVRSDNYSMGSSIRIEIKSENALMKRTEIKEVAERHERIYRDDASGEILSGGNHFVFVGIDWGFEKAMMAKNEGAIMAAINNATENANKIIEYKGEKFFYDAKTEQYCTTGIYGNSYRSIEQFKSVLFRSTLPR